MAAVKTPTIFEQLSADQVASIRAQLLLSADGLKGLKKARVLRVANDDRKGPLRQKLFAAFVNRSYARYLEDAGHAIGSKKALNAPAFITALLDWIKNNPEAVVAFITFIMSLFGL